MFLSGMRIGRTAANNSSSRRSKLLALIRLGRPSPARGVTIGPFSSTSHCLTSASTSGGRLCSLATRFSIVIPSISRISILPLSISGAASTRSTRNACFIMMGPMPSPGRMPTTILSLVEKSVGFSACFIRSMRADSLSINLPNFSCAVKISFASMLIFLPPVLQAAFSGNGAGRRKVRPRPRCRSNRASSQR